MADKMNGIANHLGDTTTAIADQIRGVANTATQAAGATQAGMEVIAQTTGTSQSLITTMNMPTKDTTTAAIAAATLISQMEIHMDQSIPILTLAVVTTQQPSML